MIEITPSLQLDEKEIEIDFIRSSGPGGQNVNKVATGVQLRFSVAASASLPEEVRARLERLAANRINAAGELVIEATRYRTQEQNRADALARLIELMQRAATPPKPRKRTRPTLASQQKRLESKRRRSALKRSRSSWED